MPRNHLIGQGRKVEICHTTRDLAQAQEVLRLHPTQMVEITRRHQELGVEMEELAFAGANQRFQTALRYVREHLEEFPHIRIAAFGMTRKPDVDPGDDGGLRRLRDAGMPVVNLVAKADPEQVEKALRTTLDENVRMVRESVQWLLAEGVEEVNVDFEHAFRGHDTDPDYVARLAEAAFEARARLVVLCDTTGERYPSEVAEAMQHYVELFPQGSFGFHGHNDQGLAVANTVVAVDNGAVHVQVTERGIGERGGNADLAGVVGSLDLRGYSVLGDEANLAKLTPTVREVAELLGVEVPPNAPFVGRDIPEHVAGLHHSAITRMGLRAYSAYDSGRYGNHPSVLMPVSDLTGQGGRSAFVDRMAPSVSPGVLAVMREHMPDLEKVIDDAAMHGITFNKAEASLLLAFLRRIGQFESSFDVQEGTQVTNVHGHGATAYMKLRVNGEGVYKASQAGGNGPVDAMNNVMVTALGDKHPAVRDLRLKSFKTKDITHEGTASKVQVVIDFELRSETFSTTGVGEDLIDASEEALVDALHYAIMKSKLASAQAKE